MIFSVISPLASSLAKPSSATAAARRTGSVAVRAGFSTRPAVDPTKIHLYKSNNCDENEKWHEHIPFSEREKELPLVNLKKSRDHDDKKKTKTASTTAAADGQPYYRKFMRASTNQGGMMMESTGNAPRGGASGSGGKISSM